MLEYSLRHDCVALMMLARINLKSQPVIGLFRVELEEPWGGPWGTNTIVDTIAPEFKRIIKDYHIPPSQTVLDTLDDRTSTFLRRMERWFGHHKYVLLGEPVGSPMNPSQDYFSGFVGIGVNDKSLASIKYGVSSSYGGISEGTSKREPVILVLDKNIQMLPWERMETGRKTERDSAVYGIVNPFDAFYVISPDMSLGQEDQCHEESRLANYLGEELELDGRLWTNVRDVIVERLKTRSFFMYAGHGDGLKYIPGGGAALRTLDRCASASLMGCSSGLLVLTGPYTPSGAPIDYLLAGSPIVISNLYEIYAFWAGYLYYHLLRSCEHEMSMADGSGLGSCLVTAKNSTDKLLMSCGTIIYGVPTLIQK
ncbi:separase isoform X1 [Tanacetum coccineum]